MVLTINAIIIILLPIISYYIGLIITKYAHEELDNKSKIFRKLRLLTLSLIIAVALFETFSSNLIYSVIVGTISFLLFFVIPKKILKQSGKLLKYIFLGIITGALTNNFYVILLICILFYFKSNTIFFSKERKIHLKLILEHLIFICFAFFSSAFSLISISVVGVSGLILLHLRLKIE